MAVGAVDFPCRFPYCKQVSAVHLSAIASPTIVAEEPSKRAVFAAIGTSLALATAKFVAAVLTGSSANGVRRHSFARQLVDGDMIAERVVAPIERSISTRFRHLSMPFRPHLRPSDRPLGSFFSILRERDST
jgi:hypothetical protein